MKMTEIFAKGKRGLIYLESEGGKKIIVKKKNPKSDVNTLKNEADFLKILNEHNVGPKFYSFNGKELRMEFIEGELIFDFIKNHNKDDIKRVLLDLLDQMLLLDKLGINKFEMTRPHKHIIINNKNQKPVLIDFERCRRAEKTKNITQFLQFITSTNIQELLKQKNIIINKQEIMDLAKEYKSNKNNFDKIKKIIQNAD